MQTFFHLHSDVFLLFLSSLHHYQVEYLIQKYLVLSTELKIDHRTEVLKADVSSVSPSWIRSDEGLMLETSALESLYGGQFTLSTPLIKPKICVYYFPTDAAPQLL